MPKLNWNKKYLTISLYVCAVLAITIAGVAVCVYLPDIFRAIKRFFEIISPIFYGLALAYLINPILHLVEKRIMKYVDRKQRTPYIKRIICLFVTYVILGAVLTLFGFLIFPELINNYDSIAENVSYNLTDVYERVREFLAPFGIKLGDLSQTISQVSNFIISYLGDIGARVGKTVLNFLIGLFLSFFVLLHHEKLRTGVKKFLAAFLPSRAFNGIMTTTSMANRIFGKFLIGKIFDSLVVGIVFLAILGFMNLPFMPKIFHIPYFFLISAVICITNIVPFVGPFIGGIPCVLLVFIDNEGGFVRALILTAVVVFVQFLEGNFIEPKVLGKTIGISSLWVVVSIIVMGNFWGIFGMVVAVPLFTVVHNLIKDITNKRLSKKQLPTEDTAYEMGAEPPPPSVFNWSDAQEPVPDPDLLSDTADESSLEGLTRKHLPPREEKKDGGDA